MRSDHDQRYYRGDYGGPRAVTAEVDLRYHGRAVAEAPSTERALFIQRTYSHLGFALLAFVALEALLVYLVQPQQVVALFAWSPWSPLLVLGAFMVVSFVAQMWSRSETSRTLQYAGLGLYVVAEAVIVLPLLLYAYLRFPVGEANALVGSAGLLTLAVFAGLTLTVFITQKDFSFLWPIVSMGTFVALGVIVAAMFFGFTLGLFFSLAIVVLMAGCILYQTSEILRSYRTDQYVAAALGLFASVATLFFYILRILIILNSNSRD